MMSRYYFPEERDDIWQMLLVILPFHLMRLPAFTFRSF